MIRHVGILCLFLLVTWPASGSVQTGSVTGSVVDQTGLVLSGTTVTLRGDGGPRTVYSDERGDFVKVNEHNGLVPRDHWIEDWERQRIIDYFDCHPLDGYRRLTFMMLDEDVVALSPSTTYRVLSKAGRLDRWNGKPSKKGTGFVQPLRPHQHWHTDISYLNLGGTFYYLCSFLDGASRAAVHWEIRESMTEADVECILERAKELYPDARPRIISDKQLGSDGRAPAPSRTAPADAPRTPGHELGRNTIKRSLADHDIAPLRNGARACRGAPSSRPLCRRVQKHKRT